MNKHTPKPHVSAALVQLQRTITTAAMVVFACATVQLLVFGFVHFTQVRYAATQVGSQSLSVVGSAPPPVVAGPRDREQLATSAGSEQATAEPVAAPTTARPLSKWDPALHMASDAAVTIGVISTFALMALTLLGVAVAAGNSTPGVEKAVSAGGWALILSFSCIPWSDVFASVPFAGVFGSYSNLTWMSQSVDLGTGSTLELISMYLLAPVAVMAASLLILSRFRAGVAEGVIVTSVNELDERLEREMATIRNRGVQAANTPRTVGALNRAIGERPEAPLPAAAEPVRTASGAQPRVGRSWSPVDRPASLASDEDEDGARRPI